MFSFVFLLSLLSQWSKPLGGWKRDPATVHSFICFDLLWEKHRGIGYRSLRLSKTRDHHLMRKLIKRPQKLANGPAVYPFFNTFFGGLPFETTSSPCGHSVKKLVDIFIRSLYFRGFYRSFVHTWACGIQSLICERNKWRTHTLKHVGRVDFVFTSSSVDGWKG